MHSLQSTAPSKVAVGPPRLIAIIAKKVLDTHQYSGVLLGMITKRESAQAIASALAASAHVVAKLQSLRAPSRDYWLPAPASAAARREMKRAHCAVQDMPPALLCPTTVRHHQLTPTLMNGIATD